MPFDTMATARLLRESGIEERQAEAITTAIKDGVTGGVATKADIQEVKSDIQEVKGDVAALKTDVAEVKVDVAALKTSAARLEAELKWIKLIGGAILAVLVLPWLAELISSTMP